MVVFPAASVTLMSAGTSMTTSSFEPGSALVDQLMGLFHEKSPPPPSHVTSDNIMRSSRRSATSLVGRRRLRNFLIAEECEEVKWRRIESNQDAIFMQQFRRRLTPESKLPPPQEWRNRQHSAWQHASCARWSKRSKSERKPFRIRRILSHHIS